MQKSKGDKVIIAISIFMVSLALLGFIGTAIMKPKDDDI
jgi:hypothetical protein